MDFAAMKRRELQALCKRNGLAAGGTNADLVAHLTATLPSSGGASEEAVGVVVGKGCLKRSAGGASGGDLDAAKKVTFEFEEDEEAEGDATGRGRRSSQVMRSPAVAKTRGRRKYGDAPPGATENGGERRRTRSQAGGDSADESDSGEAGADAPVRRSVTGKNSAKAEQEKVDVGDAVCSKHQLKRKTRENDTEDVDVSVQVGVSRRSTRSSSLLLESDALSSPVEKKRGRRKAADVKEKACVEEQPTEALHSGRTLRSGPVVVAPVPPIDSESKNSRLKVQEEKRAVEKVVKVEIPARTTRSVKEKISVKEQPIEALHSVRTLRSGAVVVAPVLPIVSKSKNIRLKVQEEEPAAEKVAKVEISARTTRSSSVAADVKEKTSVNEQLTEALHSGRTLRSGAMVVAPVPPIVSESKNSRLKVQEEEPAVEKVAKVEISSRTTRSSSVAAAVEKVAKVEISARTTRSSSVAAAVTSPRVTAKKRGRKTDDVQLDGGPDKKMDNKRQSSRLTTSSSIHHLASSGEEASLEQVAAPSKGLPPRPSRRNPSEANLMLNSNTNSESSNTNPDRHVGLKKSQLRNVGAAVATNGGEIPFADSSGKDSATDMQIEVPGPVRRITRKSVNVEKKKTVTKPVGRSTRRSVAPVILEKESKGLTKEMVPEAHVKRTTRKSFVPAMLEKGSKSIITEIIPEARVKRSTRKPVLPMVNSENNDHCEVVSSEKLRSDRSEELEKQPTVKQPVRRLTRKSAVPAMPENDRKGVHGMLNDENIDRTEMRSDKAGHLEKQVVKEPVRKSTRKSIVPDVIEKKNKGLHEELKSEVSVRTPVRKSVYPNAVNKEDKDHSEFVRTEELSVKTRSAHTRLQVALQNDGSLRRTTRKSSKLAISPPESKPTASKGRPSKRRRTSSLQEDMPAEEQKEDQIASGAHTNDVTEVATSTDLAIGVLPFTAEKSDLPIPGFRLVGTSSDEAVVSSKSDSYQGSDENSVRVEEGCTFSSQQNNQQEGVPVSSFPKDLVASAQLDPSEDTDHVVRDVITKDLICKEDEKKDFIPSDINVPDEISPANEPDENASGVSGAAFCISQSTPFSDELNYDSSRLESPGALDNRVASVNTEAVQQNNEEECNLHNGVTHVIDASGMSEAAQVEVSKSENMLLPDVETSAFQDVHSPEFNEIEEHSFSCGKDGSGKNNMSQLANEYVTEYFQEQELELPHDLSAVKSPKGSTTCHDEFVIGSGIGRTSGSIVKGNSTAMDAPVTSKQEDNLSPSATALLRIREITYASKIDAPELRSDHLSMLDSSAQAVPSVSGRLREAGFAMGNPDDKLRMEQVQQDDVHVLEGTLEKTAIVSAMPVCKHEGLPDEVEPHSLKNVICSSRVEHSPFRLQSLFSPDDVHVEEGIVEKATLGSATAGCGLPDDAVPHTFKNICSSSVEQSPCGQQSIFSQDAAHAQDGTLEKAALGSATPDCKHERGFPDEAEPHSLKERCSSSVEQSPFCLQSLFSQDDAHVQEGTLEKTTLDSVTPECKSVCGLSKETEPHSSKHEGCSTSVEQSPFALQLLFSQESTEEPSENIALAVHAKNAVAESKDIRVEYGVEKTLMPESVSDLDSSVVFSAVSRSEDCVYTSDQGLIKSSHEQEQMACPLDLLESANCMKDFANPEEVSYDEEHKKPVHSTEIISSCEKIDANGPVKHVSGLGDGLLSRSLIPSTDDSDVYPSSNPYQFESTDFLDEPKGCSSTEAIQQGLKEQRDEPKENQVTCGACPSLIEAETGKDLESEVPTLLAEKTSNMPECLILRESSKGTDMQGELVPPSAENEDHSNTCHFELQVEKTVSPEPDSSKGSDMHGDLVFPSAENEDDSVVCHVELLPNDLHTHKCPKQSTIGQDAETSALPEEQPKPELDGGEFEKCNLSNNKDKSDIFGTGYVKTDLFQLHEDSHMDLIQGKDLLNDLPDSESPEQSTIGQDAETSPLPDAQPNPKPELGEFEERNYSEDTSGIFGTEDSHTDPMLGKEFPDDLPAPKSPEQSPIGYDAGKSALPDEQPYPELELGEFEERNFSSEGTSGIVCTEDSHTDPMLAKEQLPADIPAPKSPEQSPMGHDAGKSVLRDEQLEGGEVEEQPNPELEVGEVEERNFCSEGRSDIPAPKSSEQSPRGHDAGKSALPDEQLEGGEVVEQPNPELEVSEVEERNFNSDGTSGIACTVYVEKNLFQLHDDSRVDPVQGKELRNDLHAPKSPEQSTIGQDAEASALPDEQRNPLLEGVEFGEFNFSSEDTSDIFDTGYPKDNLFQMHEDCQMDPAQEKELPNDMPAYISPEQSTIGQDESVVGSEEINTELQYEDKKECIKQNDDQATPLFSSELCEPAVFGGSESGMTLLPTADTSPLPDEKLDSGLEGEESEEHNHSCDKAARYMFSSGSVKNNTCHWDGKEEYNEHNDDQATAAMLSGDMTKPTLIEGSESDMAPLSAAGTPALTYEQLNLEDDTEQDLFFDTDISDSGLMENSDLFSLPEDAHTVTCYDYELPICTPAAKSAGESAVCPDGSVPGSVGTCQTSGRRRIDEISTKMLTIKISSAVRGSYIAMESAKKKQEDNQGQIPLLGNREDASATNADHPAELNTDWSFAEDSSTQGTSDGL